MKIKLSRQTSIILISIFALILLGAGGYLLWRVNQQDTVAPTDSSANDCPDGCYWHGGGNQCVQDGGVCLWVCSNGDRTSDYTTCPGEVAVDLECDPCTSGNNNPGTCASIPNQGSSGPAASSCDPTNCGGPCGVYTFKCGSLCYDASCGASACSYTPPAPTEYTLTYLADTGGSISGTTPQTVEEGESGTTVTAVPSTGYTFTKWDDNVTTASRTDSNVSSNITVTAEFTRKTYTLTYNAGNHGSITGETPQTVNHGGDGTAVTAVPDTNYRFSGWSDGVTTAARADTNVVANLSVTANFTTIGTYTLSYTADDHGSISGDTPQTVNHGGDGTEVRAVADTGYYFAGWSDSLGTAARTDRNVQADINVVARFSTDCGNGICEEGETAENCPADCRVVVPDTGIFDENNRYLTLGFVFIVLGFLWSTITSTVQKVTYKTVSVFQNTRNMVSKQRTEKIRKRFESKVVKK